MNFNFHAGEDVSAGGGRDKVIVPDAHLLFSGDYERSGNDLIISDHDHRTVVHDYFRGQQRPALVSSEGATVDPKIIDALTGHVDYAQAAGTSPAGKVVGHVAKLAGSASIVRNGVTVELNNGDAVYQNDVVQTGSGSTIGLVMIDGTTFNLTANARLMLNDLTFDATSTSNTSLFTLMEGAASFVAGQVAKTGDMKVGTPVADRRYPRHRHHSRYFFDRRQLAPVRHRSTRQPDSYRSDLQMCNSNGRARRHMHLRRSDRNGT